jgi:hypothetical protein
LRYLPFALEGLWILAGGEAQRGTTGSVGEKNALRQERRRMIECERNVSPASFQDARSIACDSGGFAALHHRLISAAPPAQSRNDVGNDDVGNDKAPNLPYTFGQAKQEYGTDGNNRTNGRARQKNFRLALPFVPYSQKASPKKLYLCPWAI